MILGGQPKTLTFRESENLPEVFVTDVASGVCAIAVPTFGGYAVGVLNPFADNGSVQIDELTVVVDGTTVTAADVIIHPGFGRWHVSKLYDVPDPQTATEAGRENARKTLEKFEFSFHDGLRISTPKDANGPGGTGIYMENTWAVGCRDGMEVAHYVLQGWANRNAIFRFDRASWARGLIVPHKFEFDAPFNGVDKTKTFPAQGYEFTKPVGERQGALNQLDYSHIVRMVHVAEAVAIHGSKFGFLMTLCLAADARACWIIPTKHDTGTNLHYWSLAGAANSRPVGGGSQFGGRGLNGLMRALTAQVWASLCHAEPDPEVFYDPYVGGLEMVVKFVKHCFSWDEGLLYRLGYTADNGYQPNNAWKHKVEQEQWPHRIPEGEKPPVWKGFEAALTFGGLREVEEVLNGVLGHEDHDLEDIVERMRERMAENNPTLGVWGNSRWGTHDVATWTDYILGYRKDEVIELTRTYPTPWTGDHPANSFYGDLH
jgi:hypothetical protein